MMFKRPISLRIAVYAVFAGMLAGCGDRGPERIVVSGTVTFNGKPLSEGTIRFVPAAGASSPVAGADIKDGRYTADIKGGVPVGEQRVEIEAYRVAQRAIKPDGTMPPLARGVPRTQYIPKQYNVASQLTMTIEPGSKAVTKDFDLNDR